MSIKLGIDIGGSTTKIVGFKNDGTLIDPIFIRATDPLTSLYGAFGTFTDSNNIDLKDISKILVTGAGSGFLTKPIYSLPCKHVSEFESLGRGGLYLTGLDKAIVVSMGTGTAIVYGEKGKSAEYLGGTGVGGGTLQGLSRLLLGMNDFDHIHSLAEKGDLDRVDLQVSDISSKSEYPEMNGDMTASNFGNVSDIAQKEDLAIGIFNMVYETIAMVSIFAAKSKNIRDIILTGNLSGFGICAKTFKELGNKFNYNFIIPRLSRFTTVIGAGLLD